MLRSLFIATILFAGAAQAAADKQGEFFYQTPAGQSALTPHVGYTSMTLARTGATSDSKASGFALGAEYEYGLNEQFALGATLSYLSLEWDGTPKLKNSGLVDPQVSLHGRSAMGWGYLRYGADLGLGFEKQKTASSSQDGNVASGGFSLNPYIGADIATTTDGIIGGRINYNYLMERTVDSGSGSDGKRKEGNELGLSVFYEQFFADMLIGGSYKYTSYAATKDENDAEYEKSGSMSAIALYSNIPMGGWELIPQFDYSLSKADYDKYNVMTFSVAARMNF